MPQAYLSAVKEELIAIASSLLDKQSFTKISELIKIFSSQSDKRNIVD